jgi:hypothetical protein
MNPILDAFFKSESVVNYQIDSINYFYASKNNPDNIMQQIVDETKISDDATPGVIDLDPSKTKGKGHKNLFWKRKAEWKSHRRPYNMG